MVTQNTGGRIIPPAASTVPVHKHNVADLIGLGSTPVNGGTPVYNSTSGTWTITVPSSATSPVVTPNTPTITNISSTAYFNTGQINAATSVTVTIADPTTNTDGSSYYGTSFYAIRWRYEDNTLSVTPSSWVVVQSLVGSNIITFYNVRPATTISVQAMVMDKYNNPSGWTVTSSTITYVDPAAPGQPTTPTLTSKLGGILLKWDGRVVSGASTVEQPPDYLYTDIFMSTTSGFTPSASLKVGRLNGAGAFLIMQDGSGANLTNGTRYYVKLVSYDVVLQGSVTSTETSAFAQFLVTTEIGTGQITSTMAAFNARQIGGITTTVGSTTPTSPVDGDIWLDTSSGTGVTQKTWSGSAWTVIQLNSSSIATNTITATQIAAGAITAGSAIISTAAINSAQIADLSVSKLTAGSLSVIGTLTAGGAIQTAATGARTVLDSTGLHGYNSTGSTPIFDLTTSGTFSLNSSGSSTGARIVLNTSGLTAYNSSNAPTVSIGSDGSASFSGTLTAATITGTTTISGGTIQTGTSNPRIVITASGLTAYNSAGTSIFDVSTTSATLNAATINGGTVSGGAISGGTLDIGGTASNSFRTQINGTGQITLNADLYAAAIKVRYAQSDSRRLDIAPLSMLFYSSVNDGNTRFIGIDPADTSGVQMSYVTGYLGGHFFKVRNSASAADNPLLTLSKPTASTGNIQLQGQVLVQTTSYNGAGTISVDSTVSLNSGYTGQTGDIGVSRADTTSGVIYLNSVGNRYLYYTGTKYMLPGGNIEISPTFNYTTASDAAVKTNIKTLSGMTDVLRRIRPTSFNYLDENGCQSDKLSFGVIAQEIQQILPNLVEEHGDQSSNANADQIGPRPLQSRFSVNYDGMIPVLIAAVQEIDARLTALETRKTRSKT
jgi:hypothetical protein